MPMGVVTRESKSDFDVVFICPSGLVSERDTGDNSCFNISAVCTDRPKLAELNNRCSNFQQFLFTLFFCH